MAIIYKYRYSLRDNRKALAKFLQSVRFDKENEVKEAMTLMREWTEIELEDALPLLSSKFAANHIYNEAIQRNS